LNDNEQQPNYFVVPSEVVAMHVKETHALWLAAPGKGGRAHVDTTMRKYADLQEKYKDRWDILGLS